MSGMPREYLYKVPVYTLYTVSGVSVALAKTLDRRCPLDDFARPLDRDLHLAHSATQGVLERLHDVLQLLDIGDGCRRRRTVRRRPDVRP